MHISTSWKDGLTAAAPPARALLRTCIVQQRGSRDIGRKTPLGWETALQESGGPMVSLETASARAGRRRAARLAFGTRGRAALTLGAAPVLEVRLISRGYGGW